MGDTKSRELAANIFRAAASYIRNYGWQIEGMGADGAPRCSMGALASAYPEAKWDSRLAKFMYDTLYKELDSISLTKFNIIYQDGEKVAQLYECVARKIQQSSRVLAVGEEII